MIYKCPDCKRLLVKVNNRSKELKLEPYPGVKAILRHGEVPKVRCHCGKVVLFVRGSLV